MRAKLTTVLSLVLGVFVLTPLVTCAREPRAAGSSTPETTTDTPSPKTDQASSQQSSIADVLGALVPGGTSTLLTGFLQRLTGAGDEAGNQLFMATLKEALTRNNVTEVCQESLFRTLEGLKAQKWWAWKMLDAAGKPHSGLLDDRHRWKFLGDYDQCVSVKATGTDVNDNEVTYFNGRSCLVIINPPHVPFIGKGVVIMESVCLTDKCYHLDLKFIINAVQEMLFNGTVRYTNFFTHCLEEQPPKLTTEAKNVIAVLCIICALLVIGTVYDVIVVQMKWIGTRNCPLAKPADLMGCRKEAETTDDASFEEEHIKMAAKSGDNDCEKDFVTMTTADAVKATDEPESGPDIQVDIRDHVTNKPQDTEGVVGRIILAFSVYTNGRKLLSTHQTSDDLGSIHGIRFLSMAWIILAHTYYNARYHSKNIVKYVYWEKIQQWTFMVIPYATVAVDSFFLISGTLVAYLTLRELKRVGGALKLNWLRFFCHRFWRLTPPYMLILMTGTALLPYFSNGPQWSLNSQTIMGDCRKFWWNNLLYINNFAETDNEQMCMGWTWYLADDMQFYILSPLIVLPLFYKFAVGVGVCVVFMATTLITTAVLTARHEYNVQTGVDHLSPQKDEHDFATIYAPSYTRMGPYIVGLVIGYLLYRWNCKLPQIPRLSAVLKKLIIVCLWLVAITLCCVIVYSPFNKANTNVFSKSDSVAYITLSRTVWGAALGWMVFSCACGYGGWINQLLSWRAFIPLGRLTYCAYLIHPIVQLTFISSLRQSFYWTDYTAMYLYCGHMVTSYGLAFVVSLAFEAPMVGLEKAIFWRNKSTDSRNKPMADESTHQE